MRKFGIMSLAIVMLFTSFLFSPQQVDANVRQDIVNTAHQYIGVPYHWSGSSPSGFDCSGLVQYVYRKAAGIELTRTTRTQIHEGTRVTRNNLKPGDIVFFNTTGVSPSHNGIYIGNNQFIHAGSSRGVEISRLNSSYWSPIYVGAVRIISDEQVFKPLPAGQFHDVSDRHWAKDEITHIGKAGYITGFENSFFRPEANIDRAAAATIVARVLGLSGSSSNNPFSDTSGHWAEADIAAVAAEGIIEGFEDGTFRPTQNITRGDVAVILDRAFDLNGGNQRKSFPDVSQGHYNYDAIHRLAASGIATGYQDGTYRPNAPITRAEYTVFLYRILEQQ